MGKIVSRTAYAVVTIAVITVLSSCYHSNASVRQIGASNKKSYYTKPVTNARKALHYRPYYQRGY
jgi:hypothetical protein